MGRESRRGFGRRCLRARHDEQRDGGRFPQGLHLRTREETSADTGLGGKGRGSAERVPLGEASNHFGGVQLCGTATGAAVVVADQVLWIKGANPEPVALGRFLRPREAVTVSAVANAAGWVAVGCAVMEGEPGLFLFAPREPKPSWSRIATADASSKRRPKPGSYGSPTLPDGRKQPLQQDDVPMFAPLAIAILGDGKPEAIVTADYPGWQRWVRSTATFQQQNYGLHFLAEKGVISVHDAEGKLTKQFSREELILNGWLDLRFAAPGRLIATPHT